MKKSLIASGAAFVCVAASAPAFAQTATFEPVGVYGNLGYSYVHSDPYGVSAVQGRLGARFGKYVGAEGELAFGVNSDTDTATGVALKLRNSYNGYVVGFLPVMTNVDLLARVGYGHTNLRYTAPGVTIEPGENSVNYGGGAQVFLTPHDGIRAEYTRFNFNHNNPDANVWSVSYVRKF